MVHVVYSNKIADLRWAKKAKKRNHEQNMHKSLKFFMVFSQLLGVLPQENICKSYKEMYFKWLSWRVLYTLIMSILTSTAVFFCFLHWFHAGIHFKDFETLVFYAGSVMTLILHLRLAKSWSKLMTTWFRLDKIMNDNYGYPKNLDKKLKIYFSIALILALTDYSLNVLNRYLSLRKEYQDRYRFQIYYVDLFPQLFFFVPSNIWGAMYCSMMTGHATIIWAYNDVFIILMSVGIALRFKQITEKLKQYFQKVSDFQNPTTVCTTLSSTTLEQTEQFWMEIREDYGRLTILCRELDDNISYIVLLSYSINIFFLIVQLYNSLQSVQGTIGQIYFVFSFVYIILKIVSVSLYAAWINDESLEPSGILDSVSSSSYNMEIKRLQLQISLNNVCLTGCRMFRVTRDIVLSIAGAVVTYELVLIQFNIATNVSL